MAHSDYSLMLEIPTKGTRFFKDCPLDLRVIQAYHPQVPRRCQQLLATASMVLLPEIANFKKFQEENWQKFQEELLFLLSITQKGKLDIRKVCWRGSQASYQLQGVGLCTEGK